MKTRRGHPAFLLLVLLLTLVATWLLALLPNREAQEIKTTVVHHMVANMDGWMHHLGVPQELTANLASRIPWGWLGLLAAVGGGLAVRQHRGRRS